MYNKHYKKITVLQRIFPLQIRCKPIKIRCKFLLATDLQQKLCCKNLVVILHTLAFGCKRPTDLQRNYSVVILQRISHPLLIQLLNPKNQKTINKLKLLQFRCKVATYQQPLWVVAKYVVILLQFRCNFATDLKPLWVVAKYVVILLQFRCKFATALQHIFSF